MNVDGMDIEYIKTEELLWYIEMLEHENNERQLKGDE